MGEVSEDDTQTDGKPVNPFEGYYYYHIWKARLAWTRHVIPVRAYLPRMGFFVECYIGIVAGMKEDFHSQNIEVKLAHLPVRTPNLIWVRALDIYPSSRNLSLIKDQELIDVPKTETFIPSKEIDFDTISDIFSYFGDCSFTKPELESMLNRPIPDHVIAKLSPSSEKLCLITAQKETSYDKMEPPDSVVEFTEETPQVKVEENLKDLFKVYDGCKNCELGEQREDRCDFNITTGRSNMATWEEAKIQENMVMFIGEAPGMVEEESGIAFNPKAPAGDTLAKVLSRAGFKQSECYYTNAVLCRPPSADGKTQNGKPGDLHVDACNQRLKHEIAIVRPKVIVLLGKVAYRAFFGENPKSVLGSLGWKGEDHKIYFAAHPSFVIRELQYADPSKSGKIKQEYLDHFVKVNNRFKQLKK